MAKISIVYGTREGQTTKIANALAEAIRGRGYDVSVDNAREMDSNFTLKDASAVLVGASLHIGSYEKEVAKFIDHHRDDLKRVPSAFFSVSGADADPVEEHRKWLKGHIQKFLTKHEWEPNMIGRFAGGIPFTKYGFFTKIMMKQISKAGGLPTDTSVDHEFTDWEQ